ncbi:VOC family protein [Sphingomicrobium nitratireducens]|uniref:VOC family protein n=1 Tax=Sphingomicrobium nitratireducens TaxID=2964666 RepID=UPI0030B8EE1D
MSGALPVGAALLLALAACAPAADDEARETTTQENEVPKARLDYFELPAKDAEAVAKARAFYEQAFAWEMTEFAPFYVATTTGDTDIGISAASDEDKIELPLPVIRVPDLEAALEDVEAAGGRITRPIFAFPGGRRFHAVDPAGNEIAVYQVAEENEVDAG